TEATVSTAALTFTTANWYLPQTVTVTGADDFIDDGDVSYTIITAPATSADAAYNGLDSSDVTALDSDDDVSQIILAPASGLATTEAGGAATFTVVLDTQPTANVRISLSSIDLTEGAVSVARLTFTAANWNTPQTVTLTGVDDHIIDGDQPYSITLAPAVSAD